MDKPKPKHDIILVVRGIRPGLPLRTARRGNPGRMPLLLMPLFLVVSFN